MFTIKHLDTYLTYLREMVYSKRPWAHHTKKGPGRKHQQGQAKSKNQRNNEILNK